MYRPKTPLPRLYLCQYSPVSPLIRHKLTLVAGLANPENAFYPLLIGAIALLVIFDYAS